MSVSCQNCGHESHCGVPLWKEFRRAYDHGPEGQIEVCKHCRCEYCSKIDKPSDWGGTTVDME